MVGFHLSSHTRTQLNWVFLKVAFFLQLGCLKWLRRQESQGVMLNCKLIKQWIRIQILYQSVLVYRKLYCLHIGWGYFILKGVVNNWSEFYLWEQYILFHPAVIKHQVSIYLSMYLSVYLSTLSFIYLSVYPPAFFFFLLEGGGYFFYFCCVHVCGAGWGLCACSCFLYFQFYARGPPLRQSGVLCLIGEHSFEVSASLSGRDF